MTYQSPIIPLGKRPTPGKAETSAVRAPNGQKVYLETYGCQMNVADSSLMVEILGNAGFTTTAKAAEADVILVNTCAVRDKAEERVFARMQELRVHKKNRKNVVLGIAGCMAEHLKAKILKRAPYIDIIAGPDSYRRLPTLVESQQGNSNSIVDVKLDKQETYADFNASNGPDQVSGFVSIQRGCDKFCTFCVVPFTRGRERGTPPRDILRQVRALAESGRQEVVLLGQTVNSYRYEQTSFSDLLRTVAKIPEIQRVRFTSPYPIDFNDELIATIAEQPKICNYVHLPLQSGSDSVLSRMRRGYTVENFRSIVRGLRERIPEIAISTDILSGFCGETEEDHQATLSIMREIRFDSAFMFMYSERDLTFAAKNLPDDVPEADKKRRIREIIELQQKISLEVFQAHVGRTEKVLIHSVSKRNSDQLVGRTDGFKSVILPIDAGAPGQFIDVAIQRATMATLFGTAA